ncbi:MAG: hypothetical protein H7287_07950, partial [Thermoleophilia bacterium]|nr:hypothetical protein [Thermoleophilia bacterium]
MSDARDICFEHVASCDSTQQMAAERVGALGPHQLHVVLADAQRAGRGREGRVWEDPPGAALLLSIAARGPWPCSTLD